MSPNWNHAVRVTFIFCLLCFITQLAKCLNGFTFFLFLIKGCCAQVHQVKVHVFLTLLNF